MNEGIKIEIMVEKGGIACFEQFLLSHCFQKSSAAERVCMWERVNDFRFENI